MEHLIEEVKKELNFDDKKKQEIDTGTINKNELLDTLKMFENDKDFMFLPIPLSMYKNFNVFNNVSIGQLSGTDNKLSVLSLEDTFKYVEAFNNTDNEEERIRLTKERIKTKIIEKHNL